MKYYHDGKVIDDEDIAAMKKWEKEHK